MRIAFTGGGTGGHFYPIIAVKKAIDEMCQKEKLPPPSYYYFAPTPFDADLLKKEGVIYVRIPGGKIRRYISSKNFFDLFITLFGTFVALFKMLLIMPDVLFAKGGYGSFPTLLIARFYGIPVFIHESDAVPGRVNKWAGKFAKRIAVSFPETQEFFPEKITAVTGQPIRPSLMPPLPEKEEARRYFSIEEDVPVIVVIGGSQGAAFLNDAILDAIKQILQGFIVIHQTGLVHKKDVLLRSQVLLDKFPYAHRYRTFAYLSDQDLRHAASISTLFISRAGSGIFEIAMWEKPAILIPLPPSISHDQQKNAIAYAKRGAATVIEQNNLSSNLLVSEISRIISNPEVYNAMKESTKKLQSPNAARVIAKEIIYIAKHEGT